MAVLVVLAAPWLFSILAQTVPSPQLTTPSMRAVSAASAVSAVRAALADREALAALLD